MTMLKGLHILKIILMSALLSMLVACKDNAPISKINLLDGSEFDFAQESRVVFINYWAVWCKPCIKEMPELLEFYQRNEEQALVMVVNFDMPPVEQLVSDMAKLDVQLPAALTDPGVLFDRPLPDVLPTTLVVYQQKIIDILIGPQTAITLQQYLNKMLPGENSEPLVN